jgi:GR25 family glycosyltransferase involved in LPS biosynthesis
MSEHIGLNKLEGFDPVYVINLKSRTDRFDYITNQLNENNISNYQMIEAVDGSITNWDDIVFNRQSLSLTDSELGATISHLSTIKNWLETSDSEYAIIIEDDLSFETVKYWDFTFKNFINSIKRKYDILQFCIIHNFNVNTSLHIREYRDWSAACYLITRKRAEDLISKHFVDGKYVLPQGFEALADFIVYHGAKCYSKPLFTYSLDFETSITAPNNTKEDKENPDGIHYKSKKDVISYWEHYNKEIQ